MLPVLGARQRRGTLLLTPTVGSTHCRPRGGSSRPGGGASKASAGAEPTRHGPAGAAIEAWARRGGAIEALQTANTTSRVATRTHKLTACIHSVRRAHTFVLHAHTSTLRAKSMRVIAHHQRVTRTRQYTACIIKVRRAHVLCVYHTHTTKCTACTANDARTSSVCHTPSLQCTACTTEARRVHIPCVCYTHKQCAFCTTNERYSHLISICVLHAHTSVQRAQSMCAPRTSDERATRTHRCTACTINERTRIARGEWRALPLGCSWLVQVCRRRLHAP